MGAVISYPGVYIEEIPGQSRPIPGLSQPIPISRLLVPQNSTVLRAIAARVIKGCLGVPLLVSGTNKRMRSSAVSAFARELHLNVSRIDLAQVVRKYIAETEKSRRRTLDAAEHSPALLFFDEADALFGKRSEVKDSRDRYANLDTVWFVQRLKQFRGLAILAINRRENIVRKPHDIL